MVWVQKENVQLRGQVGKLEKYQKNKFKDEEDIMYRKGAAVKYGRLVSGDDCIVGPSLDDAITLNSANYPESLNSYRLSDLSEIKIGRTLFVLKQEENVFETCAVVDYHDDKHTWVRLIL